MAERQYVYKITEVVKVTDGDTYWLRVDVGFRETVLINVRLLGYDCPEAHKGSEFEKAQAALARDLAAKYLLPWTIAGAEGTLWIRTEKDPDNFGRWLGDLWWEFSTKPDTELHLGEYLRKEDLASIWPTRWHEEFDHPEPTSGNL
jgi:endonuclease YncB( thermonuclease family)